jgi:tetratricopeptide (TPR) repeat protein
MFWDLDFHLAEREFRRALELNPEYPQAIAWYGLFHLQWISGRDGEGSELTRRFLELDPLSGYANTIWCFSCISGGRIEEAVEYGRRGVELDPKSYLAWWIFSVALQCEGQYEEAAATVEHALAISGRHSWAMMTLSAIYAGWGKPDEAKAAFRELEARSEREYIPPAMLSASAAAVGLIDRAIEFAQKGIDDRDPLLVTLSRTWPDFANLRTDPRFVKIIARLGLPGWPAS